MAKVPESGVETERGRWRVARSVLQHVSSRDADRAAGTDACDEVGHAASLLIGVWADRDVKARDRCTS